MKQYLKIFFKEDDGAVTVDWVVIVAAVVGLAITAITLIETQSVSLANATGAEISSQAD